LLSLTCSTEPSSDGHPMIDVIEGERFAREAPVGCYLCGTEHPPKLIDVAFGMRASVAECPTCRLAYQTPRPTPEASLAYMNWRWKSGDTYVSDKADQLRRANEQMRHVSAIAGAPSTLADFGAGAGSFVRAALDAGWDATGTETSSSARARAKEFYSVDLTEQFEKPKYRVVTLWDVIEHVRDPVGVLRHVRSHLEPGGWVFISTGNYESWQRLVAKRWWGLYLFDHQFYFTPHSLTKALRRSGFDEIQLIDCNRKRLRFDPKLMLRPRTFAHTWLCYARSKLLWPQHGETEEMIMVAQNPNS
jgi:SAM-dependent methyltransferase